jgi:molybdopterin synthase sulfur carrier subunit
MTVKILAFGIAKEILGGSTVSLELIEGCRAEELKAILQQVYPGLKQLTSFALAVNSAYATPDAVINAADEIAIIPPVSGG